MIRLLPIAVALVATKAIAAEVEPVVKFSHLTDLFRGEPFHPETAEPSSNALLAGIRLTVGERGRWEIDILQGVKWTTEPLGPIKRRHESASQLDVTWLPKRGQ